MALDFFAGCLGGCAGVIVGHPLDTVKVCLQTQNPNKPKYSSTIHCLKSIFLKEGMRGIYRGVSSPLGGVAAINAIVFGVYGNTQRCLKDPDSLKTITIAGALAGLVQSIISSPMELAKSRMQLNTCSKSPMDCLKKIYKYEGCRGVFKGLGITISREVPAFACYFFTYEVLTRKPDNTPVSTWSMLMAGGIAGVASWVLIYPLDVIKTRLQVDSTSKYANTIDCLKQSVKEEGISCLFRGLSPTLWRAFPVNAVTFTVVTWTMNLLNDVNLNDKFRDTEYMLSKFADTFHSISVVEGCLI